MRDVALLAAESPAVVPLRPSPADGFRYARPERVDSEIAKALAIDPSDWEFTGFKSETIIHLIVHLMRIESTNMVGRLLILLSLRLDRIAKAAVKGFDATTAEEISDAVGLEVIGLILAERSSAARDFLECKFDFAIRRRAFHQAEKRKHLRRCSSVSEGGGALPDVRPSPEELGMEAERLEMAPRQIQTALTAIRNPDHRRAVVLHYLNGWPISDRDPNRETVCAHFGKGDRTIRYWISTAMSEMKVALRSHCDV